MVAIISNYLRKLEYPINRGLTQRNLQRDKKQVQNVKKPTQHPKTHFGTPKRKVWKMFFCFFSPGGDFSGSSRW